MLLRSLSEYILKQLLFEIEVNSGRIFTSPLRGAVNILPISFTSISFALLLFRDLHSLFKFPSPLSYHSFHPSKTAVRAVESS